MKQETYPWSRVCRGHGSGEVTLWGSPWHWQGLVSVWILLGRQRSSFLAIRKEPLVHGWEPLILLSEMKTASGYQSHHTMAMSTRLTINMVGSGS